MALEQGPPYGEYDDEIEKSEYEDAARDGSSVSSFEHVHGGVA